MKFSKKARGKEKIFSPPTISKVVEEKREKFFVGKNFPIHRGEILFIKDGKGKKLEEWHVISVLDICSLQKKHKSIEEEENARTFEGFLKEMEKKKKIAEEKKEVVVQKLFFSS